jgi:hypothetical protein
MMLLTWKVIIVPALITALVARPVKLRADEYTPFEIATIEGVVEKGLPPFIVMDTLALLGFCRDIPIGMPNNTVPPTGR